MRTCVMASVLHFNFYLCPYCDLAQVSFPDGKGAGSTSILAVPRKLNHASEALLAQAISLQLRPKMSTFTDNKGEQFHVDLFYLLNLHKVTLLEANC